MSKKISQEEFENKVLNSKDGEDYIVLGKYINNKTKIKFKHKICDQEFEMDSVHFLGRGQRCPHCNKNIKKTKNEFDRELIDISNGEYRLTENAVYINYHTKIEVLHTKCGNTFMAAPSNLIRGHGCPHCFANKPKSTEEFKKDIFDRCGDEYTLSNGSKYVNNKTKIGFIHTKCGKFFEMRPNDFISGHRCPHCATLPHDSKGVLSIKKYLENNNLHFETEYRFHDCKNKNTLPFDFAVFLNDRIYLIEFDGKQHFIPMDKLGGIESFNKIQNNDNIKNEYCKINNIPLLRIPYNSINNIETLLNNFLI